ncbi:MAG: monofunctional biosynthetic peptidoglycan transglycosylase [Candidatus Dadabacteria bacterium]|nr:monofunctional biosynthetic peptidoglycan transglycosylase [Candidatus Dadabacteria bacterium]
MAKFRKLFGSVSLNESANERRFSRLLLGLAVISFLLFIIILSSGIILWLQTPEVTWLRNTNPQETAMMRYREEQRKRLGESPQRAWQWVDYPRISKHLIRSVVIKEDRRFFFHNGFDWEHIWRAQKGNIRKQRVAHGGSGVTQQLAKNLFLKPSHTLIRKVREALITYKLERELSKVRILELYLNVIELGAGIYGVEAASQAYFNKSADKLTLTEAIRLASVMSNPHRFSPHDNANRYLRGVRRHIASVLLQTSQINKSTYEQVSKDLYLNDPPEVVKPDVVPLREVSSRFFNQDYWISRLQEPDEIIMSETEIRYFNEGALLKSGGIDVFGFSDSISSNEVREKILEVAGLTSAFSERNNHNDNAVLDELSIREIRYKVKTRYDSNNNPLTEHFYGSLLDKLNIREMPDDVRVSYALVIKRADVLAWPVDELIMSKPYDYEFNALQQSAIYLGTPIVVLHTSKNGIWAFIRTTYFDGWVKKENLAFTTRKGAMAYPGPRFLVVTAPSVQTASGVDLPLGTQVLLEGTSSKGYEIKIPTRGGSGELILFDDSLTLNGVREGFLPYTRRNVIIQAFKLLGGEYSWGGNKSGWDCSLFIQDVFSVFGIKLPRNSRAQSLVNGEIARFDQDDTARDKLDTIRSWDSAISVLGLQGHIMLYLGEEGGKPYAIHALWGVKGKNGDIIKANRVTVTDLELGEGGESGSLLERVTDVRGVYLDSSDFMDLFKSFLRWLTYPPIRLVIVLLIFALIFSVILGLSFIIILMRLLEERRRLKLNDSK